MTLQASTGDLAHTPVNKEAGGLLKHDFCTRLESVSRGD